MPSYAAEVLSVDDDGFLVYNKTRKEGTLMEAIWEYLKTCGVFYLATADGDQPRIRPMHAIVLAENQLYFRAGKEKGITRQLLENPRCELCAFSGQDWLRITAKAVPSENIAATMAMETQFPRRMGDGTPQLFCLQEGTAVLSKYAEVQRVILF